MELVIFSSVVIAFIVLVAVIVGVITLARLSSLSGDPGIGTTRRIFLYGLSFVSLILTASGLTLIVDSLLEGLLGSNITTGGSGSLAFGLAATFIGFHVGAALARGPANGRAPSRRGGNAQPEDLRLPRPCRRRRSRGAICNRNRRQHPGLAEL